MSTAQDEPGRVRASDAEREEYATVLRAAVTEGRLTLAEGDVRLGQVYAARFRDDLHPLTADLPGQGRAALWQTPQAVAGVRRGLRRHGAITVAVAAILVGLWVLSGAHFFWPLLPLLFLAMSLARHARFARYARAGGPARWSGAPGSWTGHGGPAWSRSWPGHSRQD